MRRRLAVIVLTLAALGAAGLPAAAQAPTDGTQALIDQAGTTDDEQERHRLLEELAAGVPADDPLQADLAILLPLVDQWANGREKYWVPGDQQFGEQGYLAGFWNFRAHPREPDREVFPTEISADSPLHPIWAMYRGRMLIQQSIQTGFIQRDPEIRASYQGEGRELLAVASAAFPDNRILRMWLDEPIPWPALDPHPDAPEWANLQREALTKLTDVVEWWIDERQAPDGQLGGGWGDDVEIWRRWTPILVGFSHDKVEDAVGLLAAGLWDLPRLESGYTSLMSDVEHTSEDTGDTVTAMLHVDPDDPVWTGRSTRLAELMADLWTGRNDRDQLQYTSVYFTGTEVSPDAEFACDTPYTTRAVQPTLLHWQRTHDPALTDLFTDWLDTWVDATARAENGKPAGVVPAAIHWPSGEVGGPLPDWWNPGCAISIDQGLYEWPSQVSAKLRSLVLAFWVTGEDRYLEPLRSMAELRREHLADPVEDPPPGSAEWAAARMGGNLREALVKYRLVTGDEGFDDLLIADADAYGRFRLTGDDTDLLAALEDLVAALRTNREAYTTEVRWTDRLFSFESEYANHWVDPPLPRVRPDLLYQMVTGDLGDALYLPLNAVRWHTDPRDFAVLVESHGPSELTARLFHFGDDLRPVGAELLVLEPDIYHWALRCDETEEVGTVDREEDPPVVDLTVPPGQECVLTISTESSGPVPTSAAPTASPEEPPDEPTTDAPPDTPAPTDDDSGVGTVMTVLGIVVAAAVIVLYALRRRGDLGP